MDFFGQWLWFLVFVNVIFAIAVAYAAGQKGRSAAGFFFLSIFLSFIVAVLILLAVPAAQKSVSNLRECPKCLAEIPFAASKCRFCQSDVEPLDPNNQDSELFFSCSKCGVFYEFDEVKGNKCPTCKRMLDIVRDRG